LAVDASTETPMRPIKNCEKSLERNPT
jgi:hypothetical protein